MREIRRQLAGQTGVASQRFAWIISCPRDAQALENTVDRQIIGRNLLLIVFGERRAAAFERSSRVTGPRFTIALHHFTILV